MLSVFSFQLTSVYSRILSGLITHFCFWGTAVSHHIMNMHANNKLTTHRAWKQHFYSNGVKREVFNLVHVYLQADNLHAATDQLLLAHRIIARWIVALYFLCILSCECLRFIAKKKIICFQEAVSRWHSCKPARGKRVIDKKFWVHFLWSVCACVSFRDWILSSFFVSLWTNC